MPIPTDPAADPSLLEDDRTTHHERSEVAHEREQNDRFSQLYSNWLAARAKAKSALIRESDSEYSAATDEAEEAARLLMIIPATGSWMLWQKWEVLEFYTTHDDDESRWSDRRDIAFLACVKADLMSLGID